MKLSHGQTRYVVLKKIQTKGDDLRMLEKEFFWKVFKQTGHINAYLMYKDMEGIAVTRQEETNFSEIQSEVPQCR